MRVPKHVVKKTPVLDGDEAKRLLDSIDVSTIVGMRDRALIALLIYSFIYGFAQISAVLHMNVEDYYPQGKRWWVRLREKGGKQHKIPAHHLLEAYINEYVTAAGLCAEKAAPLFRTLGGRGRKQLTVARMTRQDARRTIMNRALKAGIVTRLGRHTFRATGITVYLQPRQDTGARRPPGARVAHGTRRSNRRGETGSRDPVDLVVSRLAARSVVQAQGQ